MATIPVARTWATDDFVSAADLNDEIRDAVNFLLRPPAAQAYTGAATSVPNTTLTPLEFDSQQFDTDGIWTLTPTPERFIVVTAGRYRLDGGANFAASTASDQRTLQLRVNGTTNIAQDDRPSFGALATQSTISGVWTFAVGDYVELCAYQNSGGAVDVTGSLAMTWALAS